jgi:hypothetical protein
MNSEKMALIASQKSPAMSRLQNLKAYHRLGSAARQLVKALIVEGLSVDRAIADQPNGTRIWNSRPVIDCLAAYGWQPPAKALPVAEGPAKPYEPSDQPPVPEMPCEDCGEIGRHTSRHNGHLVCHSCLCRESNIRGSQASRCQMPGCALPGQQAWDGRYLCPPHFSAEAARFASESAQESAKRRAAMRRDVLAQRGEDPTLTTWPCWPVTARPAMTLKSLSVFGSSKPATKRTSATVTGANGQTLRRTCSANGRSTSAAQGCYRPTTFKP